MLFTILLEARLSLFPCSNLGYRVNRRTEEISRPRANKGKGEVHYHSRPKASSEGSASKHHQIPLHQKAQLAHKRAWFINKEKSSWKRLDHIKQRALEMKRGEVEQHFATLSTTFL